MAVSDNRFEPTQSAPAVRPESENLNASELTPDVEEQILLLLELLAEADSGELSIVPSPPSDAEPQATAQPLRRLPPAGQPRSEGDSSHALVRVSQPKLNDPEQIRPNSENWALNQSRRPPLSQRQDAYADAGFDHSPSPQQSSNVANFKENDLPQHSHPGQRDEGSHANDLKQKIKARQLVPKDKGQNTKDEHPEDELLVQLQDLLVGSEIIQAQEKVTQLNQKLTEIENLIVDRAALIELLLPVVAELLERKVQVSQEEMCSALFPLIDKMIYQRAKQDREAVSNALAEVIPIAITKELQNHPETIANAIAPAMGAAIKEQIRLDRNSIVQALAPEMGRAIKQQVEVERDAMVDALYPVVGGTVKRYIAEAIQEINQKIANALSVEGVKRKLRAKLQGVSEAELIFKESIPVKVQAVFLIHKASGLVICQTHQSDILHLDADLIAGMLTAIRSFVNDCIAQAGSESELNEIEYGDSKILLEVAGYCYLAVVIQGEPPHPFIERIRHTLSYIIQNYSDPIEQFGGDTDTVPEAVLPLVENLMDVEVKSLASKGFPQYFVGMLTATTFAIALLLGFYTYQQNANRRLERATLSALDQAPELSLYRFSVTATQRTLTLQGRVESEFLRDQVGKIAHSLAPSRQINNQVLTVNVPPDPARVAAEVKRVEALLEREGVEITVRYQTLPRSGTRPVRGKVAIAGRANSIETQQKIIAAFEKIPGIATVSSVIALPTLNINTRIYFKNNSAQLQAVDLETKIKSLVQHLERNPDIHLRIMGYSPISEQGNSSELARRRATIVQTTLIKQGITPVRLEVQGLAGLPSDVRSDAPEWLSQCVRFEAIETVISN